MPQGSVPVSHLRVARVIHEDADELTVTIQKDENKPFPVMDGDVFYTIIFLNNTSGEARSWLPWEDAT